MAISTNFRYCQVHKTNLICYFLSHLQSTHLHGLHLQAASAKKVDNDATTRSDKAIFFNFIVSPEC